MSSLYGLAFDVSSGSMENSTNSRHIQPRCSDSKLDNFTGSLKNYDTKDGGIPITFGLNCLGWMIVFLLFCVIRRLVWDYGRLALIQKEDQGWTEMFYGSNEVNGERESPDGESQLQFPKVKQKIHTVFAIVYFIVMLLILRHFSNLFPFESGSNSSNTIMITNIPKSVTADLIQEHFQEIYGKPQILEVQLAYDFSKLKAAHRKVLAAQIGRQHCEEILQKTGQRPLTTVSTNKLSPCCQCCGASHVDGIEYFTEEEEAGKTEANEHKQKLKSLGIAFVTFQDPKVVERNFAGGAKEVLSNDAELNGAEIYIPEAYLPPVLQTTRNMAGMGSSDDVSPPQLTRRKTYGTAHNDHVIDASQLTPSSETLLTFTDEDHQ
ncbi:PREDICTED: uncharacterized protein LOC107336526 [Acropora digitifera]|uniref:uncharacterized protein LOC107336526 n=1 Tax=Acropora digitifera TaxID=70779 RepID=UPI00077A6881|nr:PREDICTED: uncharacterized protein LOC107336526 [Acropora digitifera]